MRFRRLMTEQEGEEKFSANLRLSKNRGHVHGPINLLPNHLFSNDHKWEAAVLLLI